MSARRCGPGADEETDCGTYAPIASTMLTLKAVRTESVPQTHTLNHFLTLRRISNMLLENVANKL